MSRLPFACSVRAEAATAFQLAKTTAPVDNGSVEVNDLKGFATTTALDVMSRVRAALHGVPKWGHNKELKQICTLATRVLINTTLMQQYGQALEEVPEDRLLCSVGVWDALDVFKRLPIDRLIVNQYGDPTVTSAELVGLLASDMAKYCWFEKQPSASAFRALLADAVFCLNNRTNYRKSHQPGSLAEQYVVNMLSGWFDNDRSHDGGLRPGGL